MIRTGLLIAGMLFLTPARLPAQGNDADEARQLAQSILDKGATLFDVRDAAAMAATYTEDATLILVSKDQDTGDFKVETKDGRRQIEQIYSDLFRNRDAGITSRNTVEFACRISPELLVIHGYFQPDRNEAAKYPFIQVRQKRTEQWQIMSLRLFLNPLDR